MGVRRGAFEGLCIISVIVMLMPMVLVGGCVNNNRLTSSGKDINIPQGRTFCNDNPKDSICTD